MFKSKRNREAKKPNGIWPSQVTAVVEKEPNMNIEQATQNADNNAALLRREDMTKTNGNGAGDTGALWDGVDLKES